MQTCSNNILNLLLKIDCIILFIIEVLISNYNYIALNALLVKQPRPPELVSCGSMAYLCKSNCTGD